MFLPLFAERFIQENGRKCFKVYKIVRKITEIIWIMLQEFMLKKHYYKKGVYKKTVTMLNRYNEVLELVTSKVPIWCGKHLNFRFAVYLRD